MTICMTEAAETREPVASRLWLRTRRELILAAVLSLAGLGLLPLAIFLIGERLLGEYSTEGAGVLHLYGQILRDMGSGSLVAWILVLSPWLGILLLRLLWWPLKGRRLPPQPHEEV